MSKFNRLHHQRIATVLDSFNAQYFHDNNILFGGGTRIAMELNEFRESTDIDFFCHSNGAYRAVRSQVEQHSLGKLVASNHQIQLLREIRADRDAVRTFVSSSIDDTPIKLEFIHFDFSISAETNKSFKVPVVSKESCYTTKLLANADRYMQAVPKDIFDLCMMRKEWGSIPAKSLQDAINCYGEKTINNGLHQALTLFKDDPQTMLGIAIDTLKIEPELAKQLVFKEAQSFLQDLA